MSYLPTFYGLNYLLPVFLETARVVIPSAAGPEFENAPVVAAAAFLVAVAFLVAAASRAAVVFLVAAAFLAVVVFLVAAAFLAAVVFLVAAASLVAVAFLVAASLADVAAPQDAADTALVSVFLFPVFAFAVEVYSSGHPRFLAVPNGDCYPNASSSVEVVGWEPVDNPSGVHTSNGLCSSLSSPDLHQNKNLEYYYSKPSRGYNNASDTSGLPMDATTSHSRNTCHHRYQGQHTLLSYPASRSHPALPKIQREAAGRSLY